MNKEIENTNETPPKKKHNIRTLILILIAGLFLLFIYARYKGPTGIKVKEYNVTSEFIPPSFDGFSIVQFSDLELGSTFNISDLDELVKNINDLHPDIVVFTGDLKKGYTEPLSEEDEKLLTQKLSEIDALIGKYAVRGDDDAVSDLYTRVMSNSSFKDLTNTYELIYYKGLTPIVLYGLDTMLTGNPDYNTTFSYPGELEDTSYMATYRILLAHEPDTALNIEKYNISLMLSGHSHNSELNIPFIKNYYFIKGASTYYDEHYKLGNTELYISSGLGTSKHKIRLLAKPSISLFKLYTA